MTSDGLTRRHLVFCFNNFGLHSRDARVHKIQRTLLRLLGHAVVTPIYLEHLLKTPVADALESYISKPNRVAGSAARSGSGCSSLLLRRGYRDTDRLWKIPNAGRDLKLRAQLAVLVICCHRRRNQTRRDLNCLQCGLAVSAPSSTSAERCRQQLWLPENAAQRLCCAQHHCGSPLKMRSERRHVSSGLDPVLTATCCRCHRTCWG